MSGTTGMTMTLRPEIARTLARLSRLPAHERAYAADQLRKETIVARQALSEVRRVAVLEMHASGMTWQQIGDMLGISKQKAHVYSTRQPVRVDE